MTNDINANVDIKERLKNISVTNLPEASSVKFTEEEDILARLQTMTYQPAMFSNFKGVSHEKKVEVQEGVKEEEVRRLGIGLKGASDCQNVSSGSKVSSPSATLPENSKGTTRG